MNTVIFDSDESIIINKSCERGAVTKLSQSDFLKNLEFAKTLSANDFSVVFDRIIRKIKSFTEEEFNDFKLSLPLKTYYDEEEENNI